MVSTMGNQSKYHPNRFNGFRNKYYPINPKPLKRLNALGLHAPTVETVGYYCNHLKTHPKQHPKPAVGALIGAEGAIVAPPPIVIIAALGIVLAVYGVQS